MISIFRKRLAIVSSCSLLLTVFLVHSVFGQASSRALAGDATLVIDGRVINVFQSASSDKVFLVQILVQKSEAIHLNDAKRSARYPAPGEFLYVHIDSSDRNFKRNNRDVSILPRPNMYIRANLQSGEHQDWVGLSPEWYREIGRDTQSAGTRDSDHKLGITTEQVSLRSRRALKVTRVESDSPAAKAGLEVGDILVVANGVDVTRPEQLAEEVRKSDGSMKLTVRDVRTGRDVPVEVEWDSAMRGRNQKRSLGLTTEIAFFGGNPVQKVIDVAKGSPAQLAGIKSGLLILSADGNPLPKPESLSTAERDAKRILVLQVVDPANRKESTVRIDMR